MCGADMPTICLDCRYIKPRPSGIAAVVAALAQHLPALAPDWRFKFLRHASLGHTLSAAPNVTEIALRAEPNGPANMWALPHLADFSDVDLFHAPSNILPRGLNMPTVTTIHDLMWLTAPEICNRSLWGHVERKFYGHGIKRALRQSDAIITVSDATRNAILELRPELGARTFAVLSGVSDSFSSHTIQPTILDRFGLSASRYVLTVGQYAPYKNHEGAMRGFARALANLPEITLVFVQRQGAGKLALEQLAASLGMAERVRFLPAIGQDELASLYAGAMALLHPSLCEGFGMPLGEAMASGCPVITSDCSAMPEVTSGAALLVNPNDPAAIAHALMRIGDEPGLADAMRTKGLERAAQLNWQETAKGTLQVYRRVLGIS